MTIQLLALACPQCKTPLGDPQSQTAVLYLCPSCPTALEATAGGIVAHPVAFTDGAEAPRLWWRLEAQIAIKHFSASEDTSTPWGPLGHEIAASEGKTLAVVFLIPADEDTLKASVTAALTMGDGKLATSTTRPGNATRPISARTSSAVAAQLARHSFLTRVANQPGEVHCLQFDLQVKTTSVVVISRFARAD